MIRVLTNPNLVIMLWQLSWGYHCKMQTNFSLTQPSKCTGFLQVDKYFWKHTYIITNNLCDRSTVYSLLVHSLFIGQGNMNNREVYLRITRCRSDSCFGGISWMPLAATQNIMLKSVYKVLWKANRVGSPCVTPKNRKMLKTMVSIITCLISGNSLHHSNTRSSFSINIALNFCFKKEY